MYTLGEINQIILDEYQSMDLTEEELVKSVGAIFASICHNLEIEKFETNEVLIEIKTKGA
jgi:hypothetical protein